MARIVDPAISGTFAAAFALGLLFAPPLSDAIADMVASVLPTDVGHLRLISHAQGQPAAPARAQPDALDAYNKAVNDFRSILRQRRAQINAKQPLPNLPGQALYLARNATNTAGTYGDGLYDFVGISPEKLSDAQLQLLAVPA